MIIYSLNFVSILTMIFVERKKPQMIATWFVVLNFLPIIGFIIYTLVGSGLSIKTKRMLKKKRLMAKDYEEFVKQQKKLFRSKKIKEEDKENLDLLLFNLNNSHCSYHKNNYVKVFLDGEEKIKSLKKDLEKAKHSINMLYYIFADDNVGNEIMDILIKKAQQGVKVKIIYDSVGCLRTRRKFFKPLIKAGGEVAEFFPLLFDLKLFNLKTNYRNHKKIVVIDGKIGYTGGIMALNDRLKLRSMVVAEKDDRVYIASEECAIRAICPDCGNVWSPKGGEPVVVTLNEEGRKRCL